MVKGGVRATSVGNGKTVIVDRKQSSRIAQKYGDSVAKAVQQAAEKGKALNKTALVALLTTKGSKLDLEQARTEADNIISNAQKATGLVGNPLKAKSDKFSIGSIVQGISKWYQKKVQERADKEQARIKAEQAAKDKARDEAIRAADENPIIAEMNQKAMKALLKEKMQKKAEQRKKDREIARIVAEHKRTKEEQKTQQAGQVRNPFKNKSSKILIETPYTKAKAKAKQQQEETKKKEQVSELEAIDRVLSNTRLRRTPKEVK